MTETAVVVTGHSRGIGAAIAHELLARDISVLAIARHGNAELAKRFGSGLHEVRLDLSDAPAVAHWLGTGTMRDFLAEAKLAALVNNAGLLQPIGPLETQDIVLVGQAATVNVAAALMCSAAFVSATRGARDRRILHISSGAGRKAYAGWSVYCATKAALDHHARAVALDRTPRLRINSLAPGIIETQMQAEIRASTPEKFPDHERFVTMKREGRLHDVKEAGQLIVELLLSDGFGKEPVSELQWPA
jgi:NAD(P)-dependent dehydrogenase (short-subunit alcohol dehydrogenase family)